MSSIQPPRVFTINDAARHYPGITSSAFRRLVKSGELPSRKVGVKYLITPEAIEEWLQAGKKQQPKAEEGDEQ